MENNLNLTVKRLADDLFNKIEETGAQRFWPKAFTPRKLTPEDIRDSPRIKKITYAYPVSPEEEEDKEDIIYITDHDTGKGHYLRETLKPARLGPLERQVGLILAFLATANRLTDFTAARELYDKGGHHFISLETQTIYIKVRDIRKK